MQSPINKSSGRLGMMSFSFLIAAISAAIMFAGIWASNIETNTSLQPADKVTNIKSYANNLTIGASIALGVVVLAFIAILAYPPARIIFVRSTSNILIFIGVLSALGALIGTAVTMTSQANSSSSTDVINDNETKYGQWITVTGFGFLLVSILLIVKLSSSKLASLGQYASSLSQSYYTN